MESKYEPIAIIGMGCRFPGSAVNPGAFWEMLCRGEDAICDVPADRWDPRRFYDSNPDKPGKTYVKQGGFLQQKIDLFDPLFFGISPREAEGMDPQQRLLLEVTWEAIEDAGLIADALAGSATGVFIGGFCLDNKLMRLGPFNRDMADSHTATNLSMTILANRISHVFDLCGPSVTMDTACSSSLVAAHISCRSIWSGECDLAISGGVNVMMRPEYPIIMSKGKFLSTHGRCMAFDERAAGYTRGEGAGIIILKPLSKAIKNNDSIYALIRMTGVNQDGHTTGISLPNSEAQENLIRDVYKRAGIAPADIVYFEAHGTGTQAGDPAEARAINAVLNESKKNGNKCPVGSVKTNIGHLEAAAGIAGLIKAAFCLKYRKIPPNLHFETPNPKIPFDEYCIRIPTDLEDLPAGKEPVCVSVNSFGYGGTNAHILLQEAPLQENSSEEHSDVFDKPLLLPISARSENALKELAGSYSFLLNRRPDDCTLADIVYSSAKRRTHLNHRLVALAESEEDMKERLAACSIGEMDPDILMERTAAQDSLGLVFVYTGMGPQRWGMGRELMEKEPVFAKVIEDCDAIFKKLSGWSLIEEFMADEQHSRMKETQVAQPANFAIQIALTALWESYGVRPSVVAGHSVGEVAAAYIAGALSLEDAVTVSYHRSRLQQMLAGKGAMLAVGLSESDSLKLVEGEGSVSIAAINSPAALTMTGDEKALKRIVESLNEQGVFNRFLQVEVAYHSFHMDSIKQELLDSLSKITARDTAIHLYSTVTGARQDGTEWGTAYWWKNVRRPVRFAAAVKSIMNAGYTHFLEIGPHPVLSHSIRECASALDRKTYIIPSLNRKVSDILQFRRSLASLHCMGYSIDWDKIIKDGRYVSLPTYPWQRDRYWKETARAREDRLGLPGHPFFNENIRSPQPAWQVEINDQFFPYLRDHRVLDNPVFPGAGYIEAGLALHNKFFDKQPCTLENLQFHSMLLCRMEKVQFLSITFNQQSSAYSVHSRINEDDQEWRLHAKGTILQDSVFAIPSSVDREKIKSRCMNELSVDILYSSLKKRGLNYGEHFQCVKELWSGNEEFLIRIEGHESLKQGPDDYLIHPTLLDAAFHTVLATHTSRNPFVLVSIDRVIFYDKPGQKCWAHAVVTGRTKNSLKADFIISNEDGRVMVTVHNVYSQAIMNPNISVVQDHLYSMQWERSTLQEKAVENVQGKWLIFGDADGSHDGILKHLTSLNISYTLISECESSTELLTDIFTSAEYDTLLYLRSLKNNENLEGLVDETVSTSMTLVNILKGWQQTCSEKALMLGIVTQNSQVVVDDDNGAGLSGAGLWGMGLLISNEHPNIRCKLIDVDTDLINAGQLIDEMRSAHNDTDVAIRSDERFVRRLIPYKNNDEKKVSRGKPVNTTESPVMIEQLTPGNIDTLVYQETERRKPKRGEVELQIHFSALNFKDYLKVSGRISHKVTDETFFGECLGMECSGKILAVGEDVEEYTVGDEVVAYIQGCFRPYATIPAAWVIVKTAPLSMQEAPIYLGYITALYGMVKLGQLQKGERVLIHNASGGVGLAAIQVAQWIGAELFVTAGNDKKRDYLRSLGIAHVMDSRSLKFVEEIRQAADNHGVDMVTGAVSGDALLRSFSLLAPFGRYIEIGKKDISKNNSLPMEPFNRNLSFTAVDIDRLFKERPAVIRALAKEISKGFNKGRFKPMPITVFPAAEISDAFKCMGQSKHIGKIVVDMHDQEVTAVPEGQDRESFLPDATAIIAGGTRGFGLALAKRLAEKGVGQLALLSRSGAVSEEAKAAVAEIERMGTRVMAPPVNVTDEIQVKGIIERISRTDMPLKAIFHGAMVLDDGLLFDMDVERFRRVLAPKIAGAINLHKHSRGLSPDYFVCFSSVSSIVGNRGQANYIAANAFLDAFAWYRRSLGLPATTINWGVFKEIGVVARDQEVMDLLEKSGIHGFSNEQAFEALDFILAQSPVQIGVFDIDWPLLGKTNPAAAVSSRFKNLTAGNLSEGKSEKQQKHIETLSSLKEGDRHTYLQSQLCKQFAMILKISEDKLDAQQSIRNLGIDSLITLELIFALKIEFGVIVSPMDFLKEPSIVQLAAIIFEKLSLKI